MPATATNARTRIAIQMYFRIVNNLPKNEILRPVASDLPLFQFVIIPDSGRMSLAFRLDEANCRDLRP